MSIGRKKLHAHRTSRFVHCSASCSCLPALPPRKSPWNKIQAPPLPAFTAAAADARSVAERHGHLPAARPRTAADHRNGAHSRRLHHEPANKTGLGDLYGDVWRTGGTKTKTGDQMDDFLEARAAKIETDNQSDSTTISLDCLKGDFDAVFEMFLDLLHNPEFREDKLELSQDQMYTGISRRNDDVDSDRASREPHHRVRQGQSLRARARVRDGSGGHAPGPAELAPAVRPSQQHHLRHHRRLRSPSHGGQAASRRSNRGRKGRRPRRLTIKFSEPKPGLYFIRKTDVNQSTIAMLDLGIERSNPDYYAVTVMNEIFGGGFSSRLFNNCAPSWGWPTTWEAAWVTVGTIPASPTSRCKPRAPPRLRAYRRWTTKLTTC